jgi:hypothetical protein
MVRRFRRRTTAEYIAESLRIEPTSAAPEGVVIFHQEVQLSGAIIVTEEPRTLAAARGIKVT